MDATVPTQAPAGRTGKHGNGGEAHTAKDGFPTRHDVDPTGSNIVPEIAVSIDGLGTA